MLIVGGGWLIALPMVLLMMEQQSPSLREMPWRALGAAIFAVGAMLGLVAGYYLIARGKGTPFPLDPTHELVTSGPYSYVRNPQAIAMVLAVTGEIIAVDSRAIWLMLPLTLLYLLVFAGPWEERQLTAQHGERYLAYRRRIRNWLPSLVRYEE